MLEVEVRDPLGSLIGVVVQFESEAPGVATVSGAGEVRAVDDGSAGIRVTVEGPSGVTTVEIRSRFSFAACVSSSASRLARRAGGNGGPGPMARATADAPGCADLRLQAVMGDL
jgi:hypothetical protein